MKFGQLIKLHRLKSHMTQQQLADSICSTSYLSKIEKDHAVPKLHIKNALLERLNLSKDVIHQINEQSFFKDIEHAYMTVLSLHEAHHARIVYNSFSPFSIKFRNTDYFYKTNLYLLHIAIIAEEPIETVQHLIEGIHSIQTHLNAEQQFLYTYNSALYYFKLQRYKDALKAIQRTQNLLADLTIHPLEKGAIYYLQSRIYFYLYEYGSAYTAAKKALTIYRNVDCHDYVLKCYNLLGIINLRYNNFDYALKYLIDGYEYAVQLGKTAYYGRFLQNLGLTNSRMQKSKVAIDYYMRSLEKKSDPKRQLISIHSIIKEYSKLEKDEQVVHWSNKGLSIIEQNDLQTSNLHHYYHFKAFLMIHHTKEIDFDFFHTLIAYFKNINDQRSIQKYACVAAEKAQDKGLATEALTFYKIANSASLASHNITYWQDL
ncbi:helix-turn-helix domain-containing protein [Kurthia senegalensis]|uniref:helix-turn-helix domain-containing protein n=1 Tax=Kurthia senegalensis TaxID=1033740 RepID=UPI000288D0ED|nr:helix-turn-helix transcriptional regulator [Kurthia senegalensis]